MRLVATLTLLIASMAVMLPTFAASSPEENAIEARQGMMHLRAFNLGPLVGMLKGKIPYDAAQAKNLANNLSALLDVDMRSAWMPGTSNKAYPDATEALPGIWAADSKLVEHHQALVDAVAKLAPVAGDGMEALAPAVKNVAQSCKGCHDDYKAD